MCSRSYGDLKRYKVWTPVLPKGQDATKLEAWLEEVLRVAELSASREMYAFLKIGNTGTERNVKFCWWLFDFSLFLVDLLAQAARTKRSTIAVLKPAPAPAPEAADDALAALSSDDLAKALNNLEVFWNFCEEFSLFTWLGSCSRRLCLARPCRSGGRRFLTCTATAACALARWPKEDRMFLPKTLLLRSSICSVETTIPMFTILILNVFLFC